jgi:Flp pilus assembly pilin Flp
MTALSKFNLRISARRASASSRSVIIAEIAVAPAVAAFSATHLAFLFVSQLGGQISVAHVRVLLGSGVALSLGIQAHRSLSRTLYGDLLTKVMAGNGHQRAIVPPTHLPQSGSDDHYRISVGKNMTHSLSRLWQQDDGQDVAEYSVMLAVVLVIALGTIRVIGSSANAAFSSIGSAIQ